MQQTVAELTDAYAIEGVLAFEDLADHYPVAVIRNAQAQARIALHGAHVLHYEPAGEAPLLWLSETAVFRAGKAIRGGIPICWPWFGPDPSGQGRPAHGFARDRFWHLDQVQHDPQSGTQLEFSLPTSEAIRALWPQAFKLSLTVLVGAQLELRLRMQNLSDTAMPCSGALHSYFAVADIDKTRVSGLGGRPYLDQLDGHARKLQQGDIAIDREVDRIYVDTPDTVCIEDDGHGRQIEISKRGSLSTVVWNPWIDKSAGMNDFPPGGHRQMLCVETSNAASDVIWLAPNRTHELACSVRRR